MPLGAHQRHEERMALARAGMAGCGRARRRPHGCRYINSSQAPGGQCPHAFKQVWPAGERHSVHQDRRSLSSC